MVEIDARKYGMQDVDLRAQSTRALAASRKRYWFHFLSLISIIVFMLWGFSPVLSVFWATVPDASAAELPRSRETALDAAQARW